MVDKRSKTFFWVLTLLIFASLFFTYYKYVELGNFTYITDGEAFNEALLDW